MEWDDFQRASQLGRANLKRAAADLNYARELAGKALAIEDGWNRRGRAIQKPLKCLLKAIRAQPEEVVEHLNALGNSFGRNADLNDVEMVVREALDLMSMDGRKPLPIRGAVQWLLIHYHGQGNQITNTLYGPDGVADRPSACVKWLVGELGKLRPGTHEGEVYDLLRSRELKSFLANLQKPGAV